VNVGGSDYIGEFVAVVQSRYGVSSVHLDQSYHHSVDVAFDIRWQVRLKIQFKDRSIYLPFEDTCEVTK
jgi:hypothetical protein